MASLLGVSLRAKHDTTQVMLGVSLDPFHGLYSMNIVVYNLLLYAPYSYMLHIISLRVKGKVYKTVVRPAMMYGAETWAVKKAQEKKLDVAEMRMLRWMSGVTKLDRIRNERIRGTTKVGEISKKVQESRLK